MDQYLLDEPTLKLLERIKQERDKMGEDKKTSRQKESGIQSKDGAAGEEKTLRRRGRPSTKGEST